VKYGVGIVGKFPVGSLARSIGIARSLGMLGFDERDCDKRSRPQRPYRYVAGELLVISNREA